MGEENKKYIEELISAGIKAYFNEKEIREKSLNVKNAEKAQWKKRFKIFYEIVNAFILLGGLYLVWRELGPIINMANW